MIPMDDVYLRWFGLHYTRQKLSEYGIIQNLCYVIFSELDPITGYYIVLYVLAYRTKLNTQEARWIHKYFGITNNTLERSAC